MRHPSGAKGPRQRTAGGETPPQSVEYASSAASTPLRPVTSYARLPNPSGAAAPVEVPRDAQHPGRAGEAHQNTQFPSVSELDLSRALHGARVGPTPVTPISIDGGTSLAFDVEVDELEDVVEPTTGEVVGRRLAGRPTTRPLRVVDPTGADPRRPVEVRLSSALDHFQRDFATQIRAAMRAALGGDRRQRTFQLPRRQATIPGLPAPVADLKISGPQANVFTVHLRDVLWLQVDTRTGQTQLQAKAQYLWGEGAGVRGWARWCHEWLTEVHWWLTGLDVPPEILSDMGWRVTGLEMCVDFMDLVFTGEDLKRWVGFRRSGLINAQAAQGHKFKGEDVDMARMFGAFDQPETIENGSRKGSPVSMCIYRKLTQIERQKKERTKYEACWRAHGWDGSELTRVEFRLAKQGLRIERGCMVEPEEGYPFASEIFAQLEDLDLTRVDTLWHEDVARLVWWYIGSKYRLTVPQYHLGADASSENMVATNKRETDPRWRSTVEGPARAPVSEAWARSYRQAREVQRDTLRERARRSAWLSFKHHSELHGYMGLPWRDVWDRYHEVSARGFSFLTPEEVHELEVLAGKTTAQAVATMGPELAEAASGFEQERSAVDASIRELFRDTPGTSDPGLRVHEGEAVRPSPQRWGEASGARLVPAGLAVDVTAWRHLRDTPTKRVLDLHGHLLERRDGVATPHHDADGRDHQPDDGADPGGGAVLPRDGSAPAPVRDASEGRIRCDGVSTETGQAWRSIRPTFAARDGLCTAAAGGASGPSSPSGCWVPALQGPRCCCVRTRQITHGVAAGLRSAMCKVLTSWNVASSCCVTGWDSVQR